MFNTKALLLFLSLLFIATPALSKTEETLAVGWELWYPYQYRNENQELVGLDLDIFHAILKRANLTANFAELPWKRHLNYIKTGQMDVAMGASYTKERDSYALFTMSYRQETIKLFVRKGNAKNILLDNLKELSDSGYKIGVEGGYYYGKEYETLIKTTAFRAHITEVLDLEQNIKLLMKGQLDGVLVDPFTMQAFIKKYKMHDAFEQHSLQIYSDDIQIMISKKSNVKNLLPKINKAIQSLKKDGTLTEIINNWTQLVKSDGISITKMQQHQ